MCKIRKQEFPGDPVVKIPHFHWKGLGSTPGQGTKILQASGHGQKDQNNFPLEIATHSSILAWRIPWTKEPGLQSMGFQRDRHDWSTNTFTFLNIKDLATLGQHSCMIILSWSRRAGQRLPILVPTYCASKDIQVYHSCECSW